MSALAEGRPARGPGFAVLGTGAHVVLLVALLSVYLSYVAAAKRTFDTFGLSLPLATRAVVRLSSDLSEYWWALAPATVLVGIADFVVIRVLDRERRLPAVLWVVTVALLLCAAGALTAAVIELPMASLRRALAR